MGMKTKSKKQQNRLFELLWRQTLLLMTLIALSKMGASTIDGIIMARAYGADSSAAMGLVLPFGTLTSLIGGFISTGCQTLCASAYAEGDLERSRRAFVTAFYHALTVSALLTAGTWLFAGPICAFLGARGQNASLLPEAAAYLRGLSVGTLAMVLNLVLAPVAQLYGGGRRVSQAIWLIFLADVALDLLAVLLRLGSWGIGLSTALSNFLGMGWMLSFLVFGKAKLGLSQRYFDRSMLSSVLRQGMPEAVKRFFRMAGDVIANMIVLATAAGAAMAGKTLGNMLISILTTLGLGAASSLYLLSGAYIATRDEEGLLALGRKQLWHLLLVLGFTALSFAFTPAFARLLLKEDAETLRVSVLCIRCMLLQMPFYVCFEMVTSYLQSIGRRKEANAMSFCGQTLLYLPLVTLLGLRFGAAGVILSTPLALLLTLGIFYLRLCRALHRPAALRDILHVSACIPAGEIDVAARETVESVEDAVRCSEALRQALLARGADGRTANAVALFTEEICVNIVQHGFPKSAAEHSLFRPRERAAAVFALIRDGVVTLRIYDNCVLFDPAEKRKSLEQMEASPERGLGLKLVFSMAEEAGYTSMLNMNHMLIRVPMQGGGKAAGERRKLDCRDARVLP